jgi:hypothetical protein
MAEADRLLLPHLRHTGSVGDVRNGMQETRRRIGNMEHQHASMSKRPDRMDARIERDRRRRNLQGA